MRLLPFAAAIIIFFSTAYAESTGVIINEIMYAPPAELGGMYNEWVELQNNGTSEANITGWIFSESEKNHTLSEIISPGGFLILARKPVNFTQYYSASVPVIEARFALSNEGEELVLMDAGENKVDSVSYAPAESSNGRGRTLERNSSGWFESTIFGGTPGAENSIEEQAEDQQQAPILEQPENDDLAGNVPEDSTPSNISIAFLPDSVRFGDYASMQLEIYSGGKKISGARLVAYIYSPNWISRDLSRDEATLRNRPYNSLAAAKIENIPQNSTVHAVLPVFLKCNKEDMLPEGAYSIRVRLYTSDGGSWKAAAEKDAAINVAGENPLCEKEIVYINNTSECPKCSQIKNSSETRIAKEEIVLSASAPEKVVLGENLTLNITLRNIGAKKIVVESYSYIHDHEKLLSSGFDGEKWRSTWAANSVTSEILSNGTAEVSLLSTPKSTAPPGIYSYKIVVQDMESSKILAERSFIVRINESTERNSSTEEVAVINTTNEPDSSTGNAIAHSGKKSALSRLWSWLRDRL